jgi:hypothetical protein
MLKKIKRGIATKEQEEATTLTATFTTSFLRCGVKIDYDFILSFTSKVSGTFHSKADPASCRLTLSWL